MRSSESAVAGAVSLAAGVAFVVLAWWLVPWDPVAGGGPEPVPAGEVFTAAEIARAEEFSRWARVWSWGALAASLLVVGWLGFTSAGRRLVARLPGPWWAKVLLGVVAVQLIGRLATLPLSAAGHQHRLNAGLTTQAWLGWSRDVLLAEVVAVVATGLVLLVVVGSARRWRRAWPAIAAAVAGVLVLLGSFVYPVLVQPLFNTVEPLPDGELRSRIMRLADREGVALDDVLVSDASRRTTTLNAHVSGFGATRRVVLYDNLVDGVEQDQLLSVVAHELAHAANDDVLTGSLLGAAGAMSGIGLLALVLSRRRWAGDPGVVPTVLALVAVASVLTAPVQNGISRLVETRADVEALAATDDPHAFVGLQRELALRSLADPTPPGWSQFWFGSHPTAVERVAIAARVESSAPAAARRLELVLALHAVTGVAEHVLHRYAECEDHGDDDGGDPGQEQGVLDRARS